MKILNIIESAYRGTLEEQDDAALWMTHAIKNAGAQMSMLLRGNAVNYAVKGQNADGLAIGDTPFEHPPRFDQVLLKMQEAGIGVQVVREDLQQRGIAFDNVRSQFELVSHDQVADIVKTFDLVWHW